VYAEIPTYRERLTELTTQLREEGFLALVLLDASELAHVEHVYGSRAFEEVLSTVSDLMRSASDPAAGDTDLLALNDRGGAAFLLFLAPRRGEGQTRAPRIADLNSMAAVLSDHVNRELTRSRSPYLRSRHRVAAGFSVVFHNPLILTERIIARLVTEAQESVQIQRMQASFQTRCRLQDLLLAHEIRSVFQPVVDLQHGGLLGFEALSRGPVGSPQDTPISMFEAAAQADLVFELDRHCRRRALQTARDLPAPFRLFVNIVPRSMYDTDFQGANLIRLLEGYGLSPERIVLEVSEQYAIENYTLFAEALQNFTQMGFSIAVDDIGAAHSGLEKIAHLNPRYLKFDMQLVRDIDRDINEGHVKREMARALKAFADKMDSRIIAEGIEREGEQKTLAELGIHYGQGYLLGRPAPLETFDLARPAPEDERGTVV